MLDWKKLNPFTSKKQTKENCHKCSFKEDCAITTKTDNSDIDSLLDSIQVKPKEANIEFSLVPEIDLSHINWYKKVILIMDDNELVNEFLEFDLKLFQTIAEKLHKGINFNLMEKELMELIEANNLTDELYNFNMNDYEIISVTTEYAAFAVRRYLKDIKRLDFAILDIVLGGALNNRELKQRECLNGIDVAGLIYKKFKSKTELLIYTGNDLGKYSQEVKQFKELLPSKQSLFDYLIGKDTPLVAKRLILLNFLAKRPLKSLNFVKA